jgi:hypothetical protein
MKTRDLDSVERIRRLANRGEEDEMDEKRERERL